MNEWIELTLAIRREINSNGGTRPVSWCVPREKYARIMQQPDVHVLREATKEKPDFFMGVRIIPI